MFNRMLRSIMIYERNKDGSFTRVAVEEKKKDENVTGKFFSPVPVDTYEQISIPKIREKLDDPGLLKLQQFFMPEDEVNPQPAAPGAKPGIKLAEPPRDRHYALWAPEQNKLCTMVTSIKLDRKDVYYLATNMMHVHYRDAHLQETQEKKDKVNTLTTLRDILIAPYTYKDGELKSIEKLQKLEDTTTTVLNLKQELMERGELLETEEDHVKRLAEESVELAEEGADLLDESVCCGGVRRAARETVKATVNTVTPFKL